MKTTVSLLAVLALGLPSARAQDKAQQLHDTVLKSDFPDKRLGIELGKLRTPRATELLMDLYRRGLYEKEVAIWGLMASGSPEAVQTVVKGLGSGVVTPPMRQAVVQYVEPALPALEASIAATEQRLELRRQVDEVLEVLSQSSHAGAEALLQKLARDARYPYREDAVRALVRGHGRTSKAFLVELSQDPTLSPAVRSLAAVQDPKVQQALKAVRAASFFDEKVTKGRQLGLLRSPDARVALLGLLQDENHWERSAAAAGLFALNDPQVAGVLLERRFTDPMIRDEIDAGFEQHAKSLFPELVRLYEGLPASGDPERRVWLLGVLGASRHEGARAFLKKVASNDPAMRERALAGLMRRAGPGDRAFFVALLSDEATRPYGLGFLARFGGRPDLPQLKSALTGTWRASTAIPAMDGVRRLGTPEERQKAYEEALQSGDAAIVEAAVSLFPGVHSPRILEGLLRVAREATDAEVRLRAGDQLSAYADPRMVPVLIDLLALPYSGRTLDEVVEPVLFTLMPLVVIAGQALGRPVTEKAEHEAAHLRRQQGYANALKRLTRVDHGTSHDRWKAWYQEQGQGK